MKSVLLVACSLACGVLPALGNVQTPAIFVVLGSILMGMIYFALHTKVWPARLIPWLLACTAASRIAAYWWMNTRHGRKGPVVDSDVWAFGSLAAIYFSFELYRWLRIHNESPASVSPKASGSF